MAGLQDFSNLPGVFRKRNHQGQRPVNGKAVTFERPHGLIRGEQYARRHYFLQYLQ